MAARKGQPGGCPIPSWNFADGSRRRRGCHVDIPRRRVAATPWLRRGYSEETSRGDAVVATWIFSEETSRRGAAAARWKLEPLWQMPGPAR